MNFEEITNALPLQPPEGAIEFCQSKGKLTGEVLVYSAASIKNPLTELEERAVKVTCTACGKTYYLDYVTGVSCHSWCSSSFGFYNYELKTNVTSYDSTMCPECGAEAQARHVGNIYGEYMTYESCYLTTVSKIKNLPLIAVWKIENRVYKTGVKQLIASPYEAYVFDKKRAYKYMNPKYDWRVRSYCDKWELQDKCIDNFGKSELVMPFDKHLLDGTCLENSKLDIFCKVKDPYIISYLRLYQKHPNIENLVMQGFAKLVSTQISKTGGGEYRRQWSANVEDIDFSKKRPCEMLGIPIEAYRTAKAEKWEMKHIAFYRDYCIEKDWGFLTPENAKFVYDNGVYFAGSLIMKQLPVLKTLKYLQRQKERYPNNRHRIRGSDYFDYLDMCEKLGLDTTKQSVLYPKDFVKRHDEAVKQQKFKESKVLNEKFALRKPFLDNFFFKSDGLFIRAAETQKDLIIEGEILHHCVANYADSHADGKTTIFLVRKVTEPDSPFFTLEFDFDTQTVKQNRGMRNCARTDEVTAFEQKWLNFVTKKIKELKKNGTKRNNPAA